MVKYLRQKPNTPIAKRYRLDLIEIPDEFEEVRPALPKKKSKPKMTKTKSDNDLKGYDAWRNYDRDMPQIDPKLS